MEHPQVLRLYGYVDRPYEAVRSLLREQATDLFQRATNTASERARAVTARLHVEVVGVDVGVDIRIVATKQPDEPGVAGLPPITRMRIAWKAAARESLFPSMSADLLISPMTRAETRIEFNGTYEPPLGAVGAMLDTAVGHRIAEATVHRFLNDVIEQIRRELPNPA